MPSENKSQTYKFYLFLREKALNQIRRFDMNSKERHGDAHIIYTKAVIHVHYTGLGIYIFQSIFNLHVGI